MKLLKSLCVLTLAVFMFPTQGHSQESSTTFYVSPWIATAFFGGDVGEQQSIPGFSVEKASINNAPGFGLFAGVRVANRLMIEGVFGYLPSTMLLPTSSADLNIQQGYDLNLLIYGGNVGYAFTSSKTAVVPYLSGGAGAISFSPEDAAKAFPTSPETTSEFMFNFGGGLEIPISEVVWMRLDLRDYIVSTTGDFSLFPSEDSSSLNTIVFAGGLSFRSR
jgi:hypothetical protein